VRVSSFGFPKEKAGKRERLKSARGLKAPALEVLPLLLGVRLLRECAGFGFPKEKAGKRERLKSGRA
jgi:hypothetical protein